MMGTGKKGVNLLRGYPRAYQDEAAPLIAKIADESEIQQEGPVWWLTLPGKKREAYSSESACHANIRAYAQRAAIRALVQKYGECSEHHYHGRMGSTACGRPVVAEGLCSQHLAGKKRADAKHAEQRRATLAAADLEKENQARLSRVATALGIKTHGLEYVGYPRSQYTGNAIVSLDTLEELARRLGGAA